MTLHCTCPRWYFDGAACRETCDPNAPYASAANCQDDNPISPPVIQTYYSSIWPRPFIGDYLEGFKPGAWWHNGESPTCDIGTYPSTYGGYSISTIFDDFGWGVFVIKQKYPPDEDSNFPYFHNEDVVKRLPGPGYREVDYGPQPYDNAIYSVVSQFTVNSIETNTSATPEQVPHVVMAFLTTAPYLPQGHRWIIWLESKDYQLVESSDLCFNIPPSPPPTNAPIQTTVTYFAIKQSSSNKQIISKKEIKTFLLEDPHKIYISNDKGKPLTTLKIGQHKTGDKIEFCQINTWGSEKFDDLHQYENGQVIDTNQADWQKDWSQSYQLEFQGEQQQEYNFYASGEYNSKKDKSEVVELDLDQIVKVNGQDKPLKEALFLTDCKNIKVEVFTVKKEGQEYKKILKKTYKVNLKKIEVDDPSKCQIEAVSASILKTI